ncbi:MAG: hypothetical protein IJV02_00270 [Candidatus Methanomethylophilaceae archaeon]|nr:hypothetical protein [Candidatus Methanomethylophilaceae archaeon]
MTVNTVTVVINGQTVNLTKGSGNVWTGTMTAPSKSSGSNNGGVGPDIGTPAQSLGYYPAVVTAVDTAGNSVQVDGTGSSSLEQQARLRVLETTAPTVSSLTPSSGAYIISSLPEIKFNIADAGSGLNAAKVYVKIDSGSAVTVTPSLESDLSAGSVAYTVPTALSDGSHTVTVWCYDLDGNKSAEVSTTFRVDTVDPTLNVTAPTTGSITNVAAVNVTGTTNDETSSPVTVAIKLNTVDQGTVAVSSGAFSKAITLTEGENTIEVTATDAAGRSTTQTITVTLDTQAPVITAISLEPNPADNGATVTISVTVTDS